MEAAPVEVCSDPLKDLDPFDLNRRDRYAPPTLVAKIVVNDGRFVCFLTPAAKVKTISDIPGIRIALRTMVLTGAALIICGCNVDKLANDMEAHESHFPSGHQAARGGVSYSVEGSDREWSRTFSTCRSSGAPSGPATIRFGAGGDDLPVTVVEDSTGPTSIQLDSPDGLLTFNRSSCSALKRDPIPHAAAKALQGSTGNIVFVCSSGGKTIRGRALFSQCV